LEPFSLQKAQETRNSNPKIFTKTIHFFSQSNSGAHWIPPAEPGGLTMPGDLSDIPAILSGGFRMDLEYRY
jgi:hypothetical protein